VSEAGAVSQCRATVSDDRTRGVVQLPRDLEGQGVARHCGVRQPLRPDLHRPNPLNHRSTTVFASRHARPRCLILFSVWPVLQSSVAVTHAVHRPLCVCHFSVEPTGVGGKPPPPTPIPTPMPMPMPMPMPIVAPMPMSMPAPAAGAEAEDPASSVVGCGAVSV
jgi:hypothetical protein